MNQIHNQHGQADQGGQGQRTTGGRELGPGEDGKYQRDDGGNDQSNRRQDGDGQGLPKQNQREGDGQRRGGQGGGDSGEE